MKPNVVMTLALNWVEQSNKYDSLGQLFNFASYNSNKQTPSTKLTEKETIIHQIFPIHQESMEK